jgi:hypothetical protein
MRFMRIMTWAVSTGLLWLAAAAHAQVTVGDNLHMNLDGSLAVGYFASNGNLTQSAHSLSVGGEGDLRGDYLDPRVINFVVSPYYNLSRANSSVQSIFDASGINASSQIFSGSRYPGSISYGRDWNHEGEYGLPGTVAYKTRGGDQYFNVNWSLFQPSYPSLSVSYGLGDSNYEVLGTQTKGTSDSRIFSLHSGYQLLGFNLVGGFSDFKLSQQLPEITNGIETLKGSTDQNQVQLGVSRRFEQVASFVANVSRNHFTVDFTGSPVQQTYDNLAASLSVNPARGLMVVVGGAYTDNLAGSLLQPAVGDGGVIVPPVNTSSHSLDLSATTTYTPVHDLNFQGTIDHRAQSFAGLGVTSNDYTAGVSYGHPLWGGTASGYASVTHYTANFYNQSSLGAAGSLNYSRRVGAWTGNAMVRYARNAQTVLATYTQSGHGYGLNVSRRLGSWIWTMSANGNRNWIDSVSNSSSFSQGYSSGLSSAKLSFNGNYTRSSGNSIQSLTGLVPTPIPSPGVPTTLLILYGGESYGVASGYTPIRGLILSVDYSHARYHTHNDTNFSDNLLQQADAKAEWYFRQLHFTAGYSRLLQGFGSQFGEPVKLNSFYIGVFRSMHFF